VRSDTYHFIVYISQFSQPSIEICFTRETQIENTFGCNNVDDIIIFVDWSIMPLDLCMI